MAFYYTDGACSGNPGPGGWAVNTFMSIGYFSAVRSWPVGVTAIRISGYNLRKLDEFHNDEFSGRLKSLRVYLPRIYFPNLFIAPTYR